MRIVMMLILSIVNLSMGSAQTVAPGNNNTIAGSYRYMALDSLSGIKINIDADGGFKYTVSTDVNTMHTSGRWRLIRDTLIISSSIDQKNIPISVNEEVVDSIKKHVSIEMPHNLDGDTMDEAVFNFNNDTIRNWIPFWEPDCNMEIGSIDNLRLDLNNGASSTWIKLKNKKANHLIVSVDIHGMLGSYLFLKDLKYLYKQGKLYPLPITEITEHDMRSGNMIKREVVLQK